MGTVSQRTPVTVREDYSYNGDAWNYFTHDQSRSRAYHWGEDGLAGFSDEKQRLCFALALWNGHDPILKERLFGLTNSEGNHDVKEYYFYLDSTPTHSYMKWLYKYPQRAYPYLDLVQTNCNRSRSEFEYELLDTGIFDDNRYFDVFVEYAKDSPEDVLIRISAVNRGPDAAPLDVLPTLWFRNTWSWSEGAPRPILHEASAPNGTRAIAASHPELGHRWLYIEGDAQLLFTEHLTNNERLFGTPNASPYVKDGINDYVVSGRRDAVTPKGAGTKSAAHHHLEVKPGQSGKGPSLFRPEERAAWIGLQVRSSYEISAWVWLDELSRKHGRRIALGSVPHEEWDEIAGLGFDAVWLMEVGSAARRAEKSPRYLHIRSRARGTQTAKARRSGTRGRTRPARSRTATPVRSPTTTQGRRADAVHRCACLPVLHRLAAYLPRRHEHADNGTEYTEERDHYHSQFFDTQPRSNQPEFP